MNDKKMQILKAGVRLFSERDYHSTSVQDIVSLAGISKGAFYQHYPSKEELLLAIFQYFIDWYHSKLVQTEANPALSSREKLKHSIELQFQLLLEHSEFITLQMKGTPFAFEQVKEQLISNAVFNIRWVERQVIEQYGAVIEPHAYDCAVLLNGMLKEYLFHYLFFQADLLPAELAEYLVRRLDHIAEGLIKEQPNRMLSPELMAELLPQLRQQATWKDRVNNFKKWLESAKLEGDTSAAIFRALDTVLEEAGKEQPNDIILKGMYAYLLSLTKEHPGAAERLEELFIDLPVVS
jgi:AcrR family transcriptional regulator